MLDKCGHTLGKQKFTRLDLFYILGLTIKRIKFLTNFYSHPIICCVLESVYPVLPLILEVASSYMANTSVFVFHYKCTTYNTSLWEKPEQFAEVLINLDNKKSGYK